MHYCNMSGTNRSNKMRVAFRIARNRDPNTLTAVLPDVEANPGHWMSYAHVGQHGECSKAWYYSTRPARQEEYCELLAELTGIYEPDVKLKVVQKIV